MTDKEKLEKLLTEFGIGYEIVSYPAFPVMVAVQIAPNHSYGYADFGFDLNGKFINVGVWE